MKLAGRKIVRSIVDALEAGRELLEGLLDPAGHVERVRPRELLDDEEDAEAVVDDRIPDHRLVVSDELGHVGERDLVAVTPGDGHVREVVDFDDRWDVVDVEPLVGRIDDIRRCP